MLPPKGQGTTEYALLFVFVVLLIIILLTFFAPEIGNVFSNVMEHI
jgi:Flp pilus assembly pilin Flp